MTPLISVMMPCYNAAKTLPLALASLIAQTYANWECVLVDDGSTDRPIEIVEAANDPRIRFFRFEENKGRGAARQYALDMAEGEYLCMLDADDWIYPHKLARQLEVMEEHPEIAVLSTGMAIVNGENAIVGVRVRGTDNQPISLFFPLKQPHLPPLAYAPSMIRMECAKQANYDRNLPTAEDVDYLLSLIMRYPYGAIAECTYAYSELDSVSLRKIIHALRCSRTMFEKYRREYPLAATTGITMQFLKEIIYRAGFAVGVGDRLIARRSCLPSYQTTEEFFKARHRLYDVYEHIFPEAFISFIRNSTTQAEA